MKPQGLAQSRKSASASAEASVGDQISDLNNYRSQIRLLLTACEFCEFSLSYVGSGRFLLKMSLPLPSPTTVEEKTHDSLLLTADAVRTLGPTNVENESIKFTHTVTPIIKSQRPTNFGIVPFPKRLVYDPERSAHFGLLLNVIFGLSSMFSTSPETHTATAKELTISKYSCR